MAAAIWSALSFSVKWYSPFIRVFKVFFVYLTNNLNLNLFSLINPIRGFFSGKSLEAELLWDVTEGGYVGTI
jgi:hypothetical protein